MLRIEGQDRLDRFPVLLLRKGGGRDARRRNLKVLGADVREVRGRDQKDVSAVDGLRDKLPDLRREIVLLEGQADRDEADLTGQLLQERELDLDAVLVAVGEDVLLEGGLRQGVVETLVHHRGSERRLPIVS